jgi:hypothetical protein
VEQADQVVGQGDAAAVKRRRLAGLGGVGDRLPGAARVLGDNLFSVNARPDVDGVSRRQRIRRFPDCASGVGQAPWRVVVAGRGDVVDRPAWRVPGRPQRDQHQTAQDQWPDYQTPPNVRITVRSSFILSKRQSARQPHGRIVQIAQVCSDACHICPSVAY